MMITILLGLLGGAVLIGMVFGLVVWALRSCAEEETNVLKEIEKWRIGK